MKQAAPLRLQHVLILLCAVSIPTAVWAERETEPGPKTGRPAPATLTVGNLSVTLSGRAQLQAAVLAGEDALLADGEAAEEMGFRLRRARMGIEATIDKDFLVGVEVDLLESEGSALHEAYVGWENRWAVVHAGLIKVPMSRSARISSETLQLTDRALGVRGIAPFQQVGLLVGGKVWDEKIRLSTGVFNGLNNGETFASGWERMDPTLGNRFGGFAIAARLDIDPLGPLGSGVADLNKDPNLRLGIGGGLLMNRGETVQGLGFSGDLQLKWYGVSLLAEFLTDQIEPTKEPTEPDGPKDDVARIAVTGQLGYTILRKLLDVAVRVELIDENTTVDDEGDALLIGAAVTVHLAHEHLKIQVKIEMQTKNQRKNPVKNFE